MVWNNDKESEIICYLSLFFHLITTDAKEPIGFLMNVVRGWDYWEITKKEGVGITHDKSKFI